MGEGRRTVIGWTDLEACQIAAAVSGIVLPSLRRFGGAVGWA